MSELPDGNWEAGRNGWTLGSVLKWDGFSDLSEVGFGERKEPRRFQSSMSTVLEK